MPFAEAKETQVVLFVFQAAVAHHIWRVHGFSLIYVVRMTNNVKYKNLNLIGDIALPAQIAIVAKWQEGVYNKGFVTITHRVEIDIIIIARTKPEQTVLIGRAFFKSENNKKLQYLNQLQRE